MFRAAPNSCYTQNSLLGCFPLRTAAASSFLLCLFNSLGFEQCRLLLTASCKHILGIQGHFPTLIDRVSQGAGLSTNSPAGPFFLLSLVSPPVLSLPRLSLAEHPLPAVALPAPGCLYLSAGLVFPYAAQQCDPLYSHSFCSTGSVKPGIL